ncbi:HEPN domain-containing protein [Chitinophaga sp. G-6-1-13]|uniref:HEPN domain-containing protein n=1 Tax=Chitinophaga fulva TaxID=2728842 RepID=A0A848GLY8_9BACT|nr:HEPN domain-containing protein [Chitinophaga fulva]NML39625.1 HEPN domain-containing protein [Chitinophaga fulva]
MKTTLDHLPKDKQEQLALIVQIIVESVSPEKIILFGSYARGKWVDEQHMEGGTLHEYVSDYDILVVTSKGDDRHEHELQDKIEARCHFRIPVTVIVHSIDFVNIRLSEGQYFFSDIKREGILLYDGGNIPLAELKELSARERHDIAKEDFEHWFTTAVKFLKGVDLYFKENDLNMAAFMLHQAAERTYSAAILVLTGYRPRTHNLGRLVRLCKDFSPETGKCFPNQ